MKQGTKKEKADAPFLQEDDAAATLAVSRTMQAPPQSVRGAKGASPSNSSRIGVAGSDSVFAPAVKEPVEQGNGWQRRQYLS